MKQFRYFGEVTQDYINDDLNALDYWVITRDVIHKVNDIYEKELHDDTFFDYPFLVEVLFERQPDVRLALGGQFQGYQYIVDDKMICMRRRSVSCHDCCVRK